jgi:DNA-binding response OmpR family regulator
MPGIEGYELRSRAREIHGHLPVLLITGDAYIGTRPDDGPDGGPLLRKPFTREDLLRAVAACLAEARASTPEQPAPKDTAPARTASAGVHDSPLEELPRALHELNNSLAAALGRIEICEDAAEQMDGGPHLSLNLCLHEAGQALVRASGRVQRIAELTRGAQPLSQLDDLPLAHLDQLDPPRPPGSAGGAIAPTPSDPVYAPSRQE